LEEMYRIRNENQYSNGGNDGYDESNQTTKNAQQKLFHFKRSPATIQKEKRRRI